MNIVVAMKQVPDLQQIRIRNRMPVLEDVSRTFGGIDKNALEAGVKLKTEDTDKVIVVAAGGEDLEDTIKEALASGADEAVIACDEAFSALQGDQSALLLAELIKGIEGVGLILLGEGSADNYSGQVGSRLAEILELAQVGSAVAIERQDGRALVTRQLEETEEVLDVELPAVVIVLADINEPAIPSVTKILKAGRKPKTVYDQSDFTDAGIASSSINTLNNLAPELNRKHIVVQDVPALLAALQAEGHIGR